VKKRHTQELEPVEADMTPMIDMTFQLIAFFMMIVSFSDAEQNQAIHLPSSELAKPPDSPLDIPKFVHVQKDDKVMFAGRLMNLDQLQAQLETEKLIINATPGKTHTDATIIIRADLSAKTGYVQNVIQRCQMAGFEKFALRAKFEPKKT